MLLQGAYSAKYKAVQQEKVENLRDEEREDFNVKLEKTRELSRDTNRRRRALEQRRKDYEAEEERKRREILAQRKKEIQEATEKFQRANIVRTKRKTSYDNLDRAKPNQKVKYDLTKHAENKVNGQTYYPSVDEVLAILHANRANVIERLASGDTHQPVIQDNAQSAVLNDVEQSPLAHYVEVENIDDPEGSEVTPEQRIIDQERLRSEVVGRSQPRLAFGDESEDTTEGVLPATIRRDSPSGSLSSLDSLDEVPDEVLESGGAELAAEVSDSAMVGIMKTNKTKRGNRVTFNENVTFSDGVVGTLRRPEVHVIPDTSGMGKQKSYFEITTKKMVDDGAGKEMAVTGTPCQLDVNSNVVTSKYPSDTTESSGPVSVESSSGIPRSGSTTTVPKYPSVSVAHVTPGAITSYPGDVPSRFGVATNYSGAVSHFTSAVTSYSGISTRYSGAGTYSTSATSNPGAVTNYSGNVVDRSEAVMNYSGAVPNYSGAVPNYFGTVPNYNGAVTNDAGVLKKGDRVSETPNKKLTGNVGAGTVREAAFSATNESKISRESAREDSVRRHSEVNGFKVDSQGRCNTNADDKTFEASNARVLCTSINASMLKDSLEMNHVNFTNHKGMASTSEEQTRAGTTTGLTAEIDSPETPLIPVTKKDFLSKALARTSDHTVTLPDDSNSKGTFDNPKDQQNIMSGSDKTHVYYNSNHTTPNVPNVYNTTGHHDFINKDIYKRGYDYGSVTGRVIPVHNGISGVVPNPSGTTKRSRYASDVLEHGREYDSKGSGGLQGHQRTGGIVPSASDIAKYNGHNGDVSKQGDEYNARSIREQHGHNDVRGTNLFNTAQNSRVVPNSKKKGEFLSRQNVPVKNVGSIARNGSSITNGQHRPKSHKTGCPEDLLKSVQEDIERISMVPAQRNASNSQGSTIAKDSPPSTESESYRKSMAYNHVRKTASKTSLNGPKQKSKEGKRIKSTTKRLHKPVGESGSATRKPSPASVINIQYASTQNDNQGFPTSNNNLAYVQHYSTVNDNSSRLAGTEVAYPDSESRPIEPYSQRENSWASTFERKQQKNKEGLILLDKTPTDDEINKLWETVRTCLKQEQSQRAASDSIVNNIRHSRSESGPLLGNHYLIDNNRWGPQPRPVINAFGVNSPGSESRQGTMTGYVPFRRQNSLDGFDRRSSAESSTSLALKRGSLLEHRGHMTGRRLARTQQPSRPPLNPQYFQTLRGPVTSARGPQKSNTAKAEEAKRPHLSYAEFQAVMHASADIQARNGEGETTQKKAQPAFHQPIIMNHRKEPSALSLEERRLLESLDRLNERLKTQEAVSGKLTKGQKSPNIPGKMSSMGSSSKMPQTTQHDRFRCRLRHKGPTTSPSLLNKR